MEVMTIEKLQELLVKHDKGVLKKGSHKPNSREFCALEFDSIVRGRAFSDKAITLPDFRCLNDAYGTNDIARTKALLPVMVSLWNWQEWSKIRKAAWARKVVIRTVQEILSKFLLLPPTIAKQCQDITTLSDAQLAADAAARAAAYVADAHAEAAYAARAAAYTADAAYAARAAAYVADAHAEAAYAARAAAYTADAAYAAAYAARAAAYVADAHAEAAKLSVLDRACNIWIKAAKETEGL